MEQSNDLLKIVNLKIYLLTFYTYYLSANPVVSVVKGVSLPLKQFSEQSPQIFIVGLFKEVQSSHISQVGRHLL